MKNDEYANKFQMINNINKDIKRYSNVSEMAYLLICLFAYLLICLFIAPSALAGPSDGTYELKDYGFGSGGTQNSSDGTYQLHAISGEIEYASPSSSNWGLLPGLTYMIQPNTPPAPTFSNLTGNYYNFLNLIIDTGSNPTDSATTYAIQVSTDPLFQTDVKYVQSDNTLGASLYWQTYTAWSNSGGATNGGLNIIGLTPGTTYYAKVAANRGLFQQGSFGPAASAATVNPSFTFSLSVTGQSGPPFSVGIGVINAGQVTTSWQKVTANIATNANNGGMIYLNDNNAGLISTSHPTDQILSVSSQIDLSGQLEGYGVRGYSTSGAPMEILTPFNGNNNVVGNIGTTKQLFADSTTTPIPSGGSASFEVKAKAQSTTPSDMDYSDTITVVASGSF